MPRHEQISEALLSSGAVKFGDFTLTSGRKSDFYVDVKKASSNPHILLQIASSFSTKSPQNIDTLAGLELGAIPLLVATSLEMKIPFAMIRKESRKHGTNSRIEGALGNKILVIEDVATTGGSIEDAVSVLRAEGSEVDTALVVVDREEGAKERLNKIDVSLISLVTISEIRGN